MFISLLAKSPHSKLVQNREIHLMYYFSSGLEYIPLKLNIIVLFMIYHPATESKIIKEKNGLTNFLLFRNIVRSLFKHFIVFTRLNAGENDFSSTAIMHSCTKRIIKKRNVCADRNWRLLSILCKNALSNGVSRRFTYSQLVRGIELGDV